MQIALFFAPFLVAWLVMRYRDSDWVVMGGIITANLMGYAEAMLWRAS